MILNLINPTLNYQAGDVQRLPWPDLYRIALLEANSRECVNFLNLTGIRLRHRGIFLFFHGSISQSGRLQQKGVGTMERYVPQQDETNDGA